LVHDVIRGYLAWIFATIGYRIRPYDMIADKRRWFWQERARCQFLGGWPE
jgi:hypothetical protein